MPFIATCSFCPNKIKVPDRSLGASVRCPTCGNYFTVAPAPLEPPKNLRRPAAVPRHTAEPAKPPPPAADLPWWVAAPPNEAPSPVCPEPPAPSQEIVPPSVAPEPLAHSSSALPAWINAWGATAFVLIALALLFAAFALPRFWTLAFSTLALVVSLAGMVATWENRQIKDGIWLALAGGGSSLLLVFAAFGPDWLNERWGMDFAVPEPNLNEQILVSRDNKEVVKHLADDEWADAATNAIRQGDILIRVENVAIDRLPGKKQLGLLIALRVADVGHLEPFRYHGQASGEQVAIVRDSRGKDLPRRDLGEQAKKAGQLGTISILPSHEATDLLVFEPPWVGTDYLKLELPAAAWEKQGSCKFTIPRSFIRQRKNNK